MDYGHVAIAKAIMYQAAVMDTRLSEIRDLLDKPEPEFRAEPVYHIPCIARRNQATSGGNAGPASR